MKKIKHKNNIIEYQNFLSKEDCENLIDYFNTDIELWKDTCFYNSSVMNLLDPMNKYSKNFIKEEYFRNLRQGLWALAEDASGEKLKNLTFNPARWLPGAFASPHSDNSELDGTPNAWKDNKFVTIIYLNDNYSGGELVFNQHNIKISPLSGSVVAFDPGIVNIHSVNEIINGIRYTMLASWDYEHIEYTDKELNDMKIEKELAKENQEKQRRQWKEML